jgi:hypothetical protein
MQPKQPYEYNQLNNKSIEFSVFSDEIIPVHFAVRVATIIFVYWFKVGSMRVFSDRNCT